MVKEVILVHIPFQIGYRTSGGGIRPQKMIQAFENLGHDVIVVEGGHKERAKTLRSYWLKYSNGIIKVNFIYSESSANPSILTDRKHWMSFRDYFYLRKFSKAGIPVALFYRDIHWAFTVAPKNYSLSKWYFLKILHYLDLLSYLTFVDIFLLPSFRMKKFVPFIERFKVLDELPPGHDIYEPVPLRVLNTNFKAIYVGGVLPPVYDISQLFKLDQGLEITICCREDEWTRIKDYYGKIPPHVKIVHLSGPALVQELLKHQLSLMVRENHEYLSFSQPLKFYEAIGFELPIIITSGSLISELTAAWGVGWICNDGNTRLSFDDYQQKVENIRKIKGQHTWNARAQQVIGLISKWNQTSH